MKEKKVLKNIIRKVLLNEKLNSVEKRILLKNWEEVFDLVDEVLKEHQEEQQQIQQKLNNLAELIRNQKHLVIYNRNLWKFNLEVEIR